MSSSSSLSGLENLVATLRRSVKGDHEGARSRAVLHQYQEKLKAKKARRARRSRSKSKKEKKRSRSKTRRSRSRSRSRSPRRMPVSRGLMSESFNKKWVKSLLRSRSKSPKKSRSKSPKRGRRTHVSRLRAMGERARSREEKEVAMALLLLDPKNRR